MHNERHEELLAVAAIGTPPEEDSAELAVLLAGECPECDRLLPELELSAAALSAMAPARRPPAALRRRILAAVAGGNQARPRTSPFAAWAFAAAAATLFVIVALDDARLRREREELASEKAQLAARLEETRADLARKDLRARVLESDDVRMLFLGGQGPQPQARARVFWSPAARRGILVAGNLAPLPADRQYQLWVFVAGKPVDAGVFDADPTGRALFESKDLPAERLAENFAVTVEPRGGVPQPTGPIVLVGAPS